jgi:hypothetical protein
MMPRFNRLALTVGVLAAVAGPGAAIASAKVTVTPKVVHRTTIVKAVVSNNSAIQSASQKQFSLDAELIAPANASERCGIHHPPSGRFSADGTKAIFKLDPGDALFGGKWCKGTWKVKLSIRTDQPSNVDQDVNPTDDGWVHIPLATITFKVK